MADKIATPVLLGRARALRRILAMLVSPLMAGRKLRDRYGPFVLLRNPVSFGRDPSVFAFVADPTIYQAIVSDPTTWRSINVAAQGPGNHPTKRLSVGIQRMRGVRRAHYRKLFARPMKRAGVAEMSEAMARVAVSEVETWPTGEAIDLAEHVEDLMRTLAIKSLFGDDRRRGVPIIKMISIGVRASWFLPNIRWYLAWLRIGGALEFAILEWAHEIRGQIDDKNLMSILVNNPDEAGNPASDELIVGHLPFLVGASFDTCQNALIWTLVMLAQHPSVANELAEEVRDRLAGKLPTLDRIENLKLLDAVVKEGLRLFPPVPLQLRVALRDTILGDHPVRKGTRVVLSSFLINREPSLYRDPDHFKPERWYEINPSPFENPVFSGGPNRCPGALFGTSFIKVAIAAILARHRFELVRNSRIDYKTSITLTPNLGVRAVLKGRRGRFRAVPVRGSIHEIVRLPESG